MPSDSAAPNWSPNCRPSRQPTTPPTIPVNSVRLRKSVRICFELRPMARRIPISLCRSRTLPNARKPIHNAQPSMTSGTRTPASPAFRSSMSMRVSSVRLRVASPAAFSSASAWIAASSALARDSARVRALASSSTICVPGNSADTSARICASRSPTHPHSNAKIVLMRFSIPSSF